jgi:hypothetical protein
VLTPALSNGRYARAVHHLQEGRSHAPKRAREQRAYRLVVIGGVAAIVGVVGLVLTVVGVIGAGLPVVAIVVTLTCALLFRRTISG